MESSAGRTAIGEAKTLSAEAIITIGGMVSTAVTVAINHMMIEFLGFNLLSLSVWFVVPAGAFAGGMAAASGYYAAARITQTMPSRTLLVNMVAIGLSAWVLNRWLSYIMMTFEDGTRIADVIGFWTYFQVSIESTQLTIGRAGSTGVTTGELGALGYVREFLQIAGFSLGGFATYIFLSDVEACQSCRKYAKKRVVLRNVDPGVFDDALSDMKWSLPGVADDAVAVLGGKPIGGVSLYLYTCPKCRKEWVRPAVLVGIDANATETQLTRYSVDSELTARIRAFKPPAKQGV